MRVTQEIAGILKISEEMAKKVFNQMCDDGVDFSECSKTGFRRAAKEALATLKTEKDL